MITAAIILSLGIIIASWIWDYGMMSWRSRAIWTNPEPHAAQWASMPKVAAPPYATWEGRRWPLAILQYSNGELRVVYVEIK